MLRRLFSASIVAKAAFTALGTAAAPAATTCSSVGACALFENTGAGAGLQSTSNTGVGVLGEALSTTSAGIGVHGIAHGAGLGLFGEGYAGVYGRGKVVGVYGEATDASKTLSFGFGVLGLGQGGVYGRARGNKPGVVGLSDSAEAPNAYGVIGYDYAGAPGIFGAGTTGIVAQTAFRLSGAPAPVALQLETLIGGSTSTLLRGLDATGKSVVSIDSAGNLTLAGGIVQHGTPLVTATASDGSAVMAYGPRSTAPSMEHVGEAKLTAGTAVVAFDRSFASTIDPNTPYLVFVTPEGDSRGLYVSERRPGGFVVRENAGGRSSTAFEYRIVARPLDATQTQARVIRATAAGGTLTFTLHRPDIQDARPTEFSSHLPR